MRSATSLGVMAAVALAAGLGACSSKPKEPDYRKECPKRMVQDVLGNQQAMAQVQIGKTNVNELTSLSKPTRFGTLGRAGEVGMVVGFYQTAVPGCPFVPPGPIYTPVVVDPAGVVMGHGNESMRELHRQGWVILEAAFPWQSYNYAYLPVD